MFNANGKALEGGSEEVIQCPHKHPEQVGKVLLQAQAEGRFSSVKRGQGGRKAETGSFGSWRVGS